MSKESKNLIVWSGGLDSTYIILDHIEKKEKFDTIYFELENNKNKTIVEKEHRVSIRKFLRSKYPYLNNEWRDFENICRISLTLDFLFEFTCIQQFLWFFGVAGFLNKSDTNYNKIYFGYIKEDDFWHSKHDFENIFKSMMNIQQTPDNKQISIEYPLEWFKKCEIYSQYNSFLWGREIRDLIWTCEKPRNKSHQQLLFDFVSNDNKISKDEFEPCTFCDPCKKLSEIQKIYDRLNTPKVCESITDSNPCKEIGPYKDLNQIAEQIKKL